MKLKLPRITAITYDGRPYNDKNCARYKTIYDYMTERFEFYEMKFFLTYDIQNLPTYKMEEANIQGYNEWCVYDLYKKFKTDYVLIFQTDGFALNPEKWRSEFLNYDYIGAPWPDNIGWADHKHKVGNGGFSLRSKILCEFTTTLPANTTNEDTKICSEFRHELDAFGLNIAPIEVARHFSVENPIDAEHNIETVFGYHGNQHEEAIRKKIPELNY